MVEQGFTLPFSYPNTTIVRDSKLLITEQSDGSIEYIVAMLTGELGEKAYLQLSLLEETDFANTYGNQTNS